MAVRVGVVLAVAVVDAVVHAAVAAAVVGRAAAVAEDGEGSKFRHGLHG
jgi:hypothetical protein